MFDSLILTPALSSAQSHLLTSADPGSYVLLQMMYAHMHSHLCARKGFIAERKISVKHMGLGITTVVMGGREASKTGLGIYIVSSPFGDMKRYSGGGPRVLIPSAVHRQALSVTHSQPLTCRLLLLSLKASPLPFFVHPSLSFLSVRS